MRFVVVATGKRGHSGVASSNVDLTERLMLARSAIADLMNAELTLSSQDGWHSQVRFPFIQVGTEGVFNITPDKGLVGIEVRSIPQDDLKSLSEKLQELCERHSFQLQIQVMENGIACDLDNPFLGELVSVVRSLSGDEPRLGRKLPGTSARFAPRGQGIVWGQAGIGPHSPDERHFIPSILPYYQALEEFGRRLAARAPVIDKSGGA
jgi:acetylornithine deacetylase/succinyl-diaminopimelate desuccinylase-like protein